MNKLIIKSKFYGSSMEIFSWRENEPDNVATFSIIPDEFRDFPRDVNLEEIVDRVESIWGSMAEDEKFDLEFAILPMLDYSCSDEDYYE